jgi:WD40 repeat protein
MVKAMARKTVLEGPTSMQQAAYNRSIIQCSGSFATSSKNGKVIKVWDMTVLDNKTATAEEGDDSSVTNVMMTNNVATVCLVQELQHDAVIEVIKATEDGKTIISGDVMGDILLWRKSSSNKSLLSGFKGTNKSSWSLIHKFTWRDDIDKKRGSGTGSIYPPDVIFQHSITSLCFLLDDGSKFVSGTKEGLVQIWNGNDNKLPPQTIRVAEVPLSSIQKLPSNDDDDNDKLVGLSVCCADGSIVALKLVMEEGNVVELDAFPVDCSKREIGGGSESSVISSINSIALPCKDKMGPATSSAVMLIAGDDKGNIHLTHSPLD